MVTSGFRVALLGIQHAWKVCAVELIVLFLQEGAAGGLHLQDEPHETVRRRPLAEDFSHVDDPIRVKRRRTWSLALVDR